METKTQQVQKPNVDTAFSNASGVLESIRYAKYKETQLGTAVTGLYGKLGLSEQGQKTIISSKDSKLFLGLLLSQTELKPKAKETIISDLAKINEDE